MILSDTEIIDNTHFEDVSIDGCEAGAKLLCYTVLPNGERFQEVVPDRETVQKNMIGWCNTVREYVSRMEQETLDQQVAAKKVRQSGSEAVSEDIPPSEDPKLAIIAWFEATQAEITELGEKIMADRELRDKLRDERDRIEPIIKAWRGSSD